MPHNLSFLVSSHARRLKCSPCLRRRQSHDPRVHHGAPNNKSWFIDTPTASSSRSFLTTSKTIIIRPNLKRPSCSLAAAAPEPIQSRLLLRNSNASYNNNTGLNRAFSAAMMPHNNDDDDDDDEEDFFNIDDEIEQLAASSMGSYCSDLDGTSSSANVHIDLTDYLDDDGDYSETASDPNIFSDKQQQLSRMAGPSSSLDLELGETSVWDAPVSSQAAVPQEMLESSPLPPLLKALQSMDSDHNFDDNRLFPSFPNGSAAAERHRQQQKQHNSKSNRKRHTPVLSPLAMLEQVSQRENDHKQNLTVDPLSYTGPLDAAFQENDTTTQTNKKAVPKTPQEMQQLQLQLECEAQREAVQKYQALTDQTRSRKDYASLNSLQKIILHWYRPMRDEIEQIQRHYLLKSVRRKRKIKPKDGEGLENNAIEFDRTAMNRYGPLLSALDPEKLAVIATHEALTMSIMVSQEPKNNHGGCPVVLMAQKFGQAVEEEVLLERVLKQHMEDERLKEKEKEEAKSGGTASGLDSSGASMIGDGKTTRGMAPHATKRDNNDNKDTPTNSSSYPESRLNSYLQQIVGDSESTNANPKNRRNVAYAIRKARKLMDTKEWQVEDRVHVGSILLKLLLEHATIRLSDGTVQPAFRMERRWNQASRGGQYGNSKKINKHKPGKKSKTNRFKASNVIVMHDALLKLAVADEFESIAATTTRYKPMVIPPSPWRSCDSGGYAWLKTDLIRFHGSQMQREALENADLTTVLDGLNSLSREAWVINKTILDVAQECWDNNIPLGDIPSQTNLPVPPEPTPPDRSVFVTTENYQEEDEDRNQALKNVWVKDFRAFKDARNRHRRVLQKNRDMFSLRCSAKLKLGQANQFKDYEKIYFPYNMDFRGRAYPVPPHLSNVGSDLSRGLLAFAKAKPLGPRGLYWLQVHLANLAGKDKMTFDDRAQYSIDNLENIRKAVEDPFGRQNVDSEERPWWMGLDDPFQGLATCHEIINAIDSGNPETYMCRLPVHMDGSCNGLQHYAALGLDTVGGTAVNLCDKPEPQDVYIGVMEEVIRRVADEAARELEFDENSLSEKEELSKKQKKELATNRSAKLVNGLIDRGVVKRTVMTSVYGVTYIGARTQIQEKIEEKLEEQGQDLDEINFEIFRSSGYMAKVTMDVIGDLFTGAKDTMNWLTQCARLLSAKGYPVAWMTPLGLPAIQPYRQKRASRVVTALRSMVVADYSDDLPIHKSRSVSAFPPNYIHSLDSTHMLMTALEMDRRGLSFSAVHDSFWTHPCDIDEMNEALRETFVQLYSQPLLQELKQSFELRYPDITFPDLPEKGDLDLEEVKKSKFFFQ